MLINSDKIVTNVTQSPANVFILKGDLTAATKTDVGAVLALKNVYGVDLIITNMFVDVTKVSTGSATLDIGVDDKADTSNDTLFDGLNVNAATGFFNVSKHGGSHGVHSVIWKKGEYVVATASATVAGLVGKYTIIATAL
jgi:hypothetical protein